MYIKKTKRLLVIKDKGQLRIKKRKKTEKRLSQREPSSFKGRRAKVGISREKMQNERLGPLKPTNVGIY